MKTTDSIHVAIRVRPLNEREKQAGQHRAWAIDPAMNGLFQIDSDERPLGTAPFHFDKVFDGQNTREIYDQVARQIIESSLDGFNGTIFAYGQTSSGKTHTMQGSPNEPGVIPLAVEDVFDKIEHTPEREYLLRVSYMEIYNEVIKDLLNPENDNLKIHENPNREIYVGNVTEEIVMSPEDIEQVMLRGAKNRHVGETNMNERSSRSHTIFRMVIESRDRQSADEGDASSSRQSYTGAVRVSQLNLVDLAGSERVGHTGAEGIRLKEGGHINKSLLTLGTVIGKLSESQPHIPYRDSKLTRILQPSLGGNARTAIICTVTPASQFVEETLSTLKFASRAKAVKNRPEMNEVITEETMLKRYRREISDLRHQLEELKSNGTTSASVDPDLLQEQLQHVQNEKLQAEQEKEQHRLSLEESRRQQEALRDKIEKMTCLILNVQDGTHHNSTSGGIVGGMGVGGPAMKKQKVARRKTWFPRLQVASIDETDDEEEELVHKHDENSCATANEVEADTTKSSDEAETRDSANDQPRQRAKRSASLKIAEELKEFSKTFEPPKYLVTLRTEELEAMRHEMQELRNKLDDRSRQVENLTDELKHKGEEMERVKKESDEVSQSRSRLLEQLEHFSNSEIPAITSSSADVSDLQRRELPEELGFISGLRNRFTTMVSSMAHLKDVTRRVTNDYADESKFVHLEMEQFRKECESLREDLGILRAAVEDRDAQLLSLHDELTNSKEQVGDLTTKADELDGLKARIVEMEEQLLTSQQKIRDLRKFEDAHADLESLQHLHAALKEEHDKLLEQFESTALSLQDRELEMEQVQKDLGQKDEQLEQLRAETVSMKSDLDRVCCENNAVTEQVRVLTEQVEEKTAENQKLSDELEETRQRAAENQETSQSILELDALVQTLQSEKTILSVQVQELSQEAEKATQFEMELMDVKGQVLQAAEQVQEAQDHLEAKQSELDVALGEMQSLKEQNEVLTAQIANITLEKDAEIQTLQTKLNSASESAAGLEELRAILSEKEATCQQLTEERDSALSGRTKAENDFENLRATVEKVQSKLAGITQENDDLRRDREGMLSELTAAREDNDLLRGTIETLREDRQVEAEKFNAASDAMEKRLLEMASESQRAKESLEELRGTFETMKTDHQNQIERVNMTADETEKMLLEVTEELSQARAALEERSGSDTVVAELQSKCQKLESEVKELVETNDDLKRSLKNAGEEKDSLLAAMKTLQDATESYEKKVENLSSELREMGAQVSTIPQLEEQIEDSKSRLQTAMRDLDLKQEELQSVIEENGRLAIMIPKGREMIDALQAQVASLEEGRDGLQKEKEKLELVERELRRLVADQKDQLNQSSAELVEMQKRQSDSSNTIKQLQKKCQELEFIAIEKQNLEISLSEEVKKSQGLVSALGVANEKLDAVRGELSETLAREQELKKVLEKEHAELKENLSAYAQLEAEYQRTNSRLTETTKLLDARNDEIARLHSESSHALNEVQQYMKEQVDSANSQTDIYRQEAQDLQRELDRRNADAAELVSKLSQNRDAPAEELRLALLEQQQAHSIDERRWERERAKLTGQIGTLEESVEKLKRQLRSHASSNDDRTRKLQAMAQELQQSRELLEQCQRDLRAKDVEIEKLNKQFEALENNDDDDDDVTSQNTMNVGEMGQFGALRVELEHSRKQVKSLEREVRELTLARQEALTKSSKLASELQYEKSEKEGLKQQLAKMKPAAVASPRPAVASTLAVKSPIIARHERRRVVNKENNGGQPIVPPQEVRGSVTAPVQTAHKPKRPLGRRQEKQEPECKQQ